MADYWHMYRCTACEGEALAWPEEITHRTRCKGASNTDLIELLVLEPVASMPVSLADEIHGR